jgi:hypothetical protein
MTVSTGFVLNRETIITKSGCKIEYTSGLKKGTKIWIHYKKDGSISYVEEYMEDTYQW